MIKKLKENFLILLISNMLTIIMVVVAPRIHGQGRRIKYFIR